MNPPKAIDTPFVNGEVNAGWGLHLIDVNLAMGNLVDIVREQGKAFLAADKKSQ